MHFRGVVQNNEKEMQKQSSTKRKIPGNAEIKWEARQLLTKFKHATLP